MRTLLRRMALGLGCILAVLVSSAALAQPAQANTYQTRCVVAREMRIYHTSTSTRPGHTRLYFGRTVYADWRANGRYRVYWWTLTEGWHVGWISANGRYTHAGACGTLT